MQNLAANYNLHIFRLYGAAEHGKGLIDAMSSLWVKAILRRDVVTLDMWFAEIQKICYYLINWGDERMSYSVGSPQTVKASRQ